MNRLRARQRYRLLSALALVVALPLSGCQSGADAMKASLQGQDLTAKTASIPSNDVVGSGSTAVGYLSVSGPGVSPTAQRDGRDGALMAMADLGSSALTLHAESVASGAAVMRAATDLSVKNVSFVVTDATGADLQAVTATMGRRNVPVLALRPNDEAMPKGAFSFRSTDLDGVLEALSFSIAKGGRKVVVLAPASLPKSVGAKIAASLKANGAALQAVVSVSPAGLPDQKAFKRAAGGDVLAILPGVPNAAANVKILQLAADLSPNLAIVIPAGADKTLIQNPDVEGALACRFDQQMQRRIGKAFLSRFGRPVSMDAAYGYDSVALASGLVRSRGPSALTPAGLSDPAGFSGALGVFRLESAGKARRNCDIFKVMSGRLQFFHPAPSTI